MLRFKDTPKNLPASTCRCLRKGGPMPVTELKAIFKRFDTYKDGRLSKQELRNAFASLGSHLPGWRAGRGLKQADGNRDGYVSDKELEVLLQYVLKCGYTNK